MFFSSCASTSDPSARCADVTADACFFQCSSMIVSAFVILESMTRRSGCRAGTLWVAFDMPSFAVQRPSCRR